MLFGDWCVLTLMSPFAAAEASLFAILFILSWQMYKCYLVQYPCCISTKLDLLIIRMRYQVWLYNTILNTSMHAVLFIGK